MESACAQRLFRCPQRITPPGRTYHGQALQTHACSMQRGRIRQVRRREPSYAVPCGSQRREHRQHDLQLANAFGMAKGFDKPADRPTAAG